MNKSCPRFSLKSLLTANASYAHDEGPSGCMQIMQAIAVWVEKHKSQRYFAAHLLINANGGRRRLEPVSRNQAIVQNTHTLLTFISCLLNQKTLMHIKAYDPELQFLFQQRILVIFVP